MTYYLVRGNDPDGADRIELTDEMIVGRSEASDIRVQDGHPSRRHARLTLEEGKAWVEDLGSANGTFLNDREVSEKTQLHDGDRLAFDLATFVVAAPAAQDDQATVVRRAPADADATVVRPAPTEPPAAEPPAAEPPPAEPRPAPPEPAEREASAPPPEDRQPPAEEPAPAAESPASPAAEPERPTTGGRADVPKSWADPEYQTAGTRVLTREELQAMAAGTSHSSDAGPGAETQEPHLRVVGGKSAGTVVPLDPSRNEWTIGGDAGRDLRLDDEGISAFHAKITHDSGRWRVIDQMSANGTWVNGEKVTVSYLANGDRLRFAQVECEIQLPSTGAAARTRRAPTRERSTARTWAIAAAAAAATVAVLALAAWLA